MSESRGSSIQVTECLDPAQSGSTERHWGTCWACRIPAPCDLHHVVPRFVGGIDDPTNLIPLCESCHQRVTVGFANTEFLSCIIENLSKDSCPAWARLLFLKLPELLAMSVRQNKRALDFLGLSAVAGANDEALSVQVLVTSRKEAEKPEPGPLTKIARAFKRAERRRISRRVRDGMRKAKERGIRLGRKPVEVDTERAKQLLSQGVSYAEIARLLNCAAATIWQRLHAPMPEAALV